MLCGIKNKVTKMDTLKFLTTITINLIMTSMVIGQNWTNVEGGLSSDYGGGIALDGQKNIYISGTFSGAFDTTDINGLGIAKYNNTGIFQWAWQPQYYSWGTAYNNDVAIDSKNNVYVIGYLQDTVKIGDSIYTPAQPDSWEEFFITKLDSNKNVDWAIRAQGYDTLCQGNCMSRGRQIEINQNDNIYVSIELYGDMEIGGDTAYSFCNFQNIIVKLHTTGNIVWIHDGGDHFAVDQNNYYYVANNNTLTKYNDAGIIQWTRTFSDSIYTLQINKWGFLHIATLDKLYRLKASDGISIWTAPTLTEMYHTICSDSIGNVILSGYKFPPPPFPYYSGTYNEYFDSIGTAVGFFYWGKPVTIHNTRAADISLTNNFLYILGQIAVTSTFPNTSSFIYGTDTLPNIANFDIFVSKIKISDWLIPTGITELSVDQFYLKAYPNPFIDKLVIEIDNHLTTHSTLTLFDITGRRIRQKKINNNKTELHLGKLSAGLYFLQLRSLNRQETIKIIK